MFFKCPVLPLCSQFLIPKNRHCSRLKRTERFATLKSIQTTNNNYRSILSAALLVSGTSLGAGLLALPIQTGLSGLLPALVGLIVLWALMLGTGIILADLFVNLGQPSAGLFTLYRQSLGSWSRWLITPTFLLIFYGILVAYLSGSGSVLSSLLHLPQMKSELLILFFVISSGVVLVGMSFIQRANAGCMFLLIGSFAIMLFLVGRDMDSKNLLYQDWAFLPSALPIIICSFAYQNIVPSICTSLGNNRRQIRLAFFYGTLLTLLVNAVWIIVVLGVLPLNSGNNSLLNAFHHNQPATIPLSLNSHSATMQFCGLFFSITALFTSYVAVGEGLRNFLTDLFGSYMEGKSNGRLFIAILTFVPPLLISLIYPDLFLKMLNIVGGLGVVTLFGLFPSLIFFRQARTRKRPWQQLTALLLCILFSTLLALECGQEAGMLQIHPKAEYFGQ